jgi:excisionase family DNA binding protein
MPRAKTATIPAAPPLFISRAEAGRILSVSLSTVDKLIERGQLSAYKVARTVRLRYSDVLAAARPR